LKKNKKNEQKKEKKKKKEREIIIKNLPTALASLSEIPFAQSFQIYPPKCVTVTERERDKMSIFFLCVIFSSSFSYICVIKASLCFLCEFLNRGREREKKK